QAHGRRSRHGVWRAGRQGRRARGAVPPGQGDGGGQGQAARSQVPGRAQEGQGLAGPAASPLRLRVTDLVGDLLRRVSRSFYLSLAVLPRPLREPIGLAALDTLADLDRYTYLVAGCVGEFWTRLHIAHRPRLGGWDGAAMSATGVRFGKALQLTNVLRDVPADLRHGRCYLPARELAT